MLRKIKFVLGAMDPEMEVIKTVLDTVGANYEFAILNGALVNPTNAYECGNELGEAEKICFIECRNPQIIEFISIDHHNKGDYGYKLGANKFLEASSIGQLLSFLANNFQQEFNLLNFIGFIGEKSTGYSFNNKMNMWVLGCGLVSFLIPEQYVVVAATDHCSGEAYRGNCKGISFDMLLNDRIHSLSSNLQIAKDLLKEKLNSFTNFFRETKSVFSILDLTHLELGVGYSEDYLILREAAILNNRLIAVITKNELNGGRKLMLLSLTESQVEDFLESGVFGNLKVKEPFGVPVRGYAGGMLE